MNRPASTLDTFLKPASVAVIGASPEEHRLRGMMTSFIVKNNYRGRLYFINPNHTEIRGIKCYPEISALPEAVDLAIIFVPASNVISALQASVAAGAKNALVMASGFAEEGGAQLEKQAA